jgi:hypothetical protein
MNRRRYLALCTGVSAPLAGCANRSAEPSESESGSPSATERQTSTSNGRATEPTSPTEPPSTAAPAPHLGRFVLWNDDDVRHRIGITVSREGVVVDETRELGPGVSADVENPIETQGVYAVVATVDGERRAEREWEVSRCDSIEYLQVYVDDDGEGEIRTMRQTIDPHPTC